MRQFSPGNTEGWTKMRAIWTVDRGSWSPVHWPRQDGSISPRQVLCSKMGSVLSFGMVTN